MAEVKLTNEDKVELQDKMKESLNLIRNNEKDKNADEDAWILKDFYNNNSVSELIGLVLIFSQLDEYHGMFMELNPFPANLVNASQLRRDVNVIENNFCNFLYDYLKLAREYIKKIHFCVLGLRMKLETEKNLTLVDEYTRLLALFTDVCCNMFTDIPSKDGNKKMQVDMIDEYAFPIAGPENFNVCLLPTFINAYRTAQMFNIVAVKIQLVFEAILSQRERHGKTISDKRFNDKQAELYNNYQAIFSPFIKDGNSIACTNPHSRQLNRRMIEIYHVFKLTWKNETLDKRFSEVWEKDGSRHWDLSKMNDVLKLIIEQSNRRRNLLIIKK